MKSITFILKKLSKELLVEEIAYSIGIVACALLFLLSFQLFFVVRNQPNKATLGSPLGKKGQIAAQLKKGISKEGINDLYLDLRRWKEISGIQLILGQEITKDYNLPKGFSNSSSIFIIHLEDNNPKTITKLEKNDQITLAASLKKAIRASPGLTLPGWIKPLSLAAVLAFALAAVVLLYSLTTYISKRWRGEFEILKYSGIKNTAIKIPITIFGTASGIVSSGLSIIILLIVSSWAKNTGWASSSLPSLLDGSFIMGLVLWSLLLGPVISLSGILVGLKAIDKEW